MQLAQRLLEPPRLALRGRGGLLANDKDSDGDPLTATKLSNPSAGALTLQTNGGFHYDATGVPDGEYSFTYKVNDGVADSNVATVTIHVGGEGEGDGGVAGLVAHFSFDGNLTDSVDGDVGVASMTPQFDAGRFGAALWFDGEDDKLTISAATLPSGNAARTLSLWAKDAPPSGHDWKFAAMVLDRLSHSLSNTTFTTTFTF